MIRAVTFIAACIALFPCGCASVTGRSADPHPPCGALNTAMREAAVPRHLRDLVPHALKWGTGDPEVRDMLLSTITGEETRTLRDALHGREGEIRDWIGASARPTGETCAFSNLLLFYQDLNDIELMKGFRRPPPPARGERLTPSQ